MEILLASLAMLMLFIFVTFLFGLIIYYVMNKLGAFKDEFDTEDDRNGGGKTFFNENNLSKDVAKDIAVSSIGLVLTAKRFVISGSSSNKPWGFELKIQESQAPKFLEAFFGKDSQLKGILFHPVGPKILVIEEFKRLSWHVHERKDAYLRVLRGKVDVYVSWLDAESQPTTAIAGELISIPPLLRHRLGSKDGWAVIAEISRDVDPDHPSDDLDERRIADDFGRE